MATGTSEVPFAGVNRLAALVVRKRLWHGMCCAESTPTSPRRSDETPVTPCDDVPGTWARLDFDPAVSNTPHNLIPNGNCDLLIDYEAGDTDSGIGRMQLVGPVVWFVSNVRAKIDVFESGVPFQKADAAFH